MLVEGSRSGVLLSCLLIVAAAPPATAQAPRHLRVSESISPSHASYHALGLVIDHHRLVAEHPAGRGHLVGPDIPHGVVSAAKGLD